VEEVRARELMNAFGVFSEAVEADGAVEAGSLGHALHHLRFLPVDFFGRGCHQHLSQNGA